jgi:hypothetical protein
MGLDSVLSPIPTSLASELESTYNEIVRNFREARWEPSELNGGKFCEVVYSILKGYADGNYPSAAYKPSNMVDDCRALESAKHATRSVRIQIPRMLVALYEVRNNRGVGHVGGDVNPNHMDALVVLQMCKWILSELIRVFHSVSLDEANSLVESLADRTLPLIWKANGKIRVLNPALSYKDKTLAVLYSESSAALTEKSLLESVEHSNPTVYRKDILKALHRLKMIDYEEATRMVTISPIGLKHVEDNIQLTI